METSRGCGENQVDYQWTRILDACASTQPRHSLRCCFVALAFRSLAQSILRSLKLNCVRRSLIALLQTRYCYKPSAGLGRLASLRTSGRGLRMIQVTL